MSKIAISTTTLAALVLAACGGGAPPPPAGPPVERGIFISSGDCADSKKLSPEECDTAIEGAVAQHEAQAVVYKTVRACEAVAGPERCNKTGASQFRPRLQAFFVVMAKPPTAVPLYAPKASSMAFQSLSKQIVYAKDETITVSASAITLANENAKLPETSADGAAGQAAAAADIH